MEATPAAGLPRELWSIEVDLADVADLSTDGARAALGLPAIAPRRSQWRSYQRVGARLVREGYRGILAPSAAREGGIVLVAFARARSFASALLPTGPAEQIAVAPVVPRGLRI